MKYALVEKFRAAPFAVSILSKFYLYHISAEYNADCVLFPTTASSSCSLHTFDMDSSSINKLAQYKGSTLCLYACVCGCVFPSNIWHTGKLKTISPHNFQCIELYSIEKAKSYIEYIHCTIHEFNL